MTYISGFIKPRVRDKILGGGTSVKFDSKIVYEDTIFDRQDILQFFARESKYYKYFKYIYIYIKRANGVDPF